MSKIFLLVLAYFVVGRLGLLIPYVGSHITLVWLPTGIAVAALLRSGQALWPGIFLGAFFVNLSIGSPWPLAASIAVGNTLGPLLAASWLKRVRFHSSFDRQRDIVLFIALASLGMAVSATGGICSLKLADVLPLESMGLAWLSWWMGDTVGVLLAAPLLLTLTRKNIERLVRARREILLWLLVAGPVAWIAFILDYAQFGHALPMAFLTMPLFVWAALRFGVTGAALAGLIFSVIAAWSVAAGRGTFFVSDIHVNLFVLWSYMAMTVLTGLLITALQAELAESQRLARLGSWYWDYKTGVWEVSEGFHRIFGREFVPRFAEQNGTMYSKESWEALNSAALQTVRSGEGFDLELPALLPGKGDLCVHLRSEAVLEGSGDVCGLRGTVQDITERWLAQNALLESQTRFRATFEQAAVGMAHVALDGRWLQINAKLCGIIGYEEEELRRLNFQDITHPDDLMADLDLVEQMVAGEIFNYSMEKRYIRKNGDLVWVNLTVALVRSEEGTPEYFIAVVEEIQRRKEAEAALQAARNAYRQHLEQEVAERTAELREARTHLEERVAERTKQLRSLAAEATIAEERERQAIARDLHDDLGQLLHVAKIKIGLLRKQKLAIKGRAFVDDIDSLIADASRQVRSLTSQLSPPILTTLGLPAALRWLSGEIQHIYQLSVECDADVPELELPAAQSAILFRAARELLINAAKHSGSCVASLCLMKQAGNVILTVEDAGKGISVEDVALAGKRGFGLASMHERITFLGGQMKIETPADGGLRIVLQLPLDIMQPNTLVTN